MNVKKIISSYEKALEEEKQKKELEKQKEIELLVQNAEQIELVLKNTVEPVFRSAEKDIAEMGYPCEITFVSRKPRHLPDSYRNFAIEIKMTTGLDTMVSSGMTLRYEGDFEKMTLTMEMKLRNSHPEKSAPKPLSFISQEKVEKDLEDFLGRVFVVSQV